MNTTFSEMIDRLTATTPEQEDYTGEDGLLYCGKCHKPKEAYFAPDKAAIFGLSLIHISAQRGGISSLL